MEIKSYSKKQAGVVYRAFKEGKIEATKEDISCMYDHVGECYITNCTRDYIEEVIASVRLAVDAIFEGNYALATDCMAALN